MRNSPGFIPTVDSILASLDKSPSLELGLDLCNEILKLMGFEIKSSAPDVIDKGLVQLPNSERYDSWFQPHPWMGGERAVFELNDLDTTPLQAKFYWLNKRSRQFIAGSVHFTENWEDSDYTHNDKFRAGVDFFLSPNGKSLQVVLSNRGNLRIVELHKRLNNTQVEIFAKWEGASQLTTQEALHNTLWESFKLKAVNEKFYAEIANNFTLLTQHLKTINKDEEESKLFASRLLGRLLFCWFLRKKGIIDEAMDYFNTDGLDSTQYYRQSLERLFFLTLNTPIDERDELNKNHQKELIHFPSEDKQSNIFKVDDRTPYLNGGLFEPHTNDWFKDETLTFPTGYFVNLYKHFDEFNFTTDESTPEYEQIAIDPEMLGRVFESLLATQIDETGQQAHKAKGTFYTPREIVSYMCKESLRNYMYSHVDINDSIKQSIDGLLDTSDSEWAKAGTNSKRDTLKDYKEEIIDALDSISIIDPACGSGAFPMGMVQLLMRMYERLESRFDPYKTKLQIIQNNIFGVDIEPMAVEIARLRAWLSLAVDEEDGRNVDPLPNLDFKFVCANSLVPLNKELGLFSDTTLHQKLKDIRIKYFNARIPKTKKVLQDEYYKLTKSEQVGLIADDMRTKQLKSFDPFKNSHPSDFFDSDQMFGQESFGIVIGNPPYVDYRKIDSDTKTSIKDYAVTKYSRMINLYNYFFESGIKLLKENGILAYISPQQYLILDNCKGLRDIFRENKVILLSDFARVKVFDASTYTFVTLIQKQISTEPAKYLEFNQIGDLNNPIRSLDIMNPIPEPVNISEHSSLIQKIEKTATRRLGSICDIFCASSSTSLKLSKKSTEGLGFITASDIKNWHIDTPSQFVTLSSYSAQSATKQHDEVIYTSRMTKTIRATYVANNHYLGGKVNVVKPQTGISPYFVTAILNSSLVNFWYREKYSMQHMQGGALPINTPELKNIPIIIENVAVSRIDQISKDILTNPELNQASGQEKIDQLVYQLYDLTPKEIAIVEGESSE